jgi:beta-glucosidase
MKKLFNLLFVLPVFANAQQQFTSTPIAEGIHKIKVNNQITLAYATESGVKIILKDGLPFKDLNKNAVVDAYEDWRLDVNTRAKDLASKMSVEQIAGLMLYSGHQAIPMPPAGMFKATYSGKAFAESGAKPYDLTDQQIEFLKKDNLRHVLVTSLASPEVAALWNNNGNGYSCK